MKPAHNEVSYQYCFVVRLGTSMPNTKSQLVATNHHLMIFLDSLGACEKSFLRACLNQRNSRAASSPLPHLRPQSRLSCTSPCPITREFALLTPSYAHVDLSCTHQVRCRARIGLSLHKAYRATVLAYAGESMLTLLDDLGPMYQRKPYHYRIFFYFQASHLPCARLELLLDHA